MPGQPTHMLRQVHLATCSVLPTVGSVHSTEQDTLVDSTFHPYIRMMNSMPEMPPQVREAAVVNHGDFRLGMFARLFGQDAETGGVVHTSQA